MRTLNATEFKAKCLRILDEVASTGEPVTILKRGKPVAQLVPPQEPSPRYPQDELEGTVTYHEDISGPVLPATDWKAERGEF